MTAHDLNSALRDFAPALANHLWQSTAFAAVAGLLTLALRTNQAHTRHWIWMAASLKFLLPFAMLAGIAGHFAKPRVVAPANTAVYSAVEDFSEPFAVPFTVPIAAPVIMRPHRSASEWLPIASAIVWLAGFVVALIVWTVRWRRVARTVRAGEPISEGREVAILRRLEQMGGARRPMRMVLSESAMEPGVFGIARPVLAWPAGISERLDDAHMETVLAHEVCHVRRWDNLTALLHMFVEAAFWFHPLVWWMGARLVAERERACDEEVLQLLNRPQVYAESILKVCEFCVESPLECVAGITGADLKKRIVEIMRARAVLKLTWGKKLLIGAAVVCAIAVPVMLGQAKAAQRMMLAAIKDAPKPIRFAAHAMIAEEETPSNGEIADASPASVPGSASDPCSTAEGAKFDVVSIRPSKAGMNDWDSEANADSVSLSGTTKGLIQEAFGLRDFQITGGPDWIASDTYDIKAKFDPPDNAKDASAQKATARRWVQRYHSLLQDRFQFKCHMSTKELPVYDLVVAKGGAKLKPATAGGNDDSTSGHGDAHKTQVVATGVNSEDIVATLARYVDRTVVDKTGLSGKYDFTLNWSTQRQTERNAQDGELSLPELPTALEEQLGLKLVPSKGPSPVLVIDHIEKPTVDGAEVQQLAASIVPVAMVQDKAGSASANDSAQPPAYVPTMTFDVASVRESKPDPSGWTTVGGGFEPINSSHWRVGNNDLMNLILQAYDVNSHLIEGIPRSLGYPTTFNAEAKGDPAADEKLAKLPKEQVHLEQQHMIQTLLAERFHMKAHWETRDGPTYDLVVSKPGRLVSTGAPPSAEELKGFGNRPIPALYQKGDSRTGFEFIAHGATMESILPMFASQFGRPVTDKTGLTGKYDFDLKYYQTRASDRKDDETNPWAPLETAIQDQLGLKLVSTHGPVHYLVIDHVELPTEN